MKAGINGVVPAVVPPRGGRYHGTLTVLASLLVGCTVSDPGESPAASRLVASPSPSHASLRGLCAVDRRVAWASGAGGAYGRTTDGGARWVFNVVPGARHLDFRDAVALDEHRAWLMAAGPGSASRIYRTGDGGRRWRLQWTNPHPEGFLDGMAAWDGRRAMAYGDPVGGHLHVMITDDGGVTWRRGDTSRMPAARDGEAGFAASGTGIRVAHPSTAWIATGGANVARVFTTRDGGASWTAVDTPLTDPSSTSGIFSLAFKDARHGVAVGGDYARPAVAHANAAWTDDGGLTWHRPKVPPGGYRSGVSWIPGSHGLICVGPDGADCSYDGGRTWQPLPGDGYHAVRAVDGGGFASGAGGRLATIR